MKLYKKIKSILRPQIHTTIIQKKVSNNEVLEGKVALITGATSGIGFSIAESFINAGCTVLITGRNNKKINDACIKLKSICNSNKVYGFFLDNLNTSTFTKTFSDILSFINDKGYSHIDILVNNAGINGNSMPYIKEDEYDTILNVNLKSVYYLSEIFGKYFIENKINGNILNISSASCIRPGNSPYILSKWGLRSLTLGLAKSLGSHGITVNAIAPGPTATKMTLNNNSNLSLTRIPLGRYIMPEEIASMAVFLVSDMGKSIMGDTIFMTGGAGLLTFDDVNYSF